MAFSVKFEDELMEAREIAHAKGLKEGLATGLQIGQIALIRKHTDNGKDIDFIADALDVDEEYVEKVVRLIRDNPDMNDLDIFSMIEDK